MNIPEFLAPTSRHVWTVIGDIGLILFFMRFLVQWIASEKKKTIVVPVSFWYFSIAGGALLLAYSLYQRDPVFIVGQGLGVFIYVRNLYFIHRKAKTAAPDKAL